MNSLQVENSCELYLTRKISKRKHRIGVLNNNNAKKIIKQESQIFQKFVKWSRQYEQIMKKAMNDVLRSFHLSFAYNE